MAAPVGNKFWEQRSTHGREKAIESPEVLWDSACEYFEWCEENPLIEIDFRGKDAERIELPKMRAFTWEGLELFIDLNLRDYKTKDSHKEFLQVITRIDKVIKEQKFTGAAAGFLNATIISRDLGLRDATDITSMGNEMKQFTLNVKPDTE